MDQQLLRKSLCTYQIESKEFSGEVSETTMIQIVALLHQSHLRYESSDLPCRQINLKKAFYKTLYKHSIFTRLKPLQINRNSVN